MAVPFGSYVLERWLAQGGMANIFLATYTGPLGFEREVVLKVILPEYAHHPGFISMFLDEARLAARLNHPNIVQVHDLGQVGGYYYIAMEYVAGPSLSRAVARARREGRTLSTGLTLFVIGELLEALSYAHQRRDRSGRPLGIVHRDVTPQNVLLSFDGHAKLTDFGVAKANINLHDSQAGVIKGKYSHMAPEQCLGRPVDERADLFAVGIVLHELLTGKPLFLRPTTYEMMRAVIDEPIPSPSEINPKSPGELDGVVLKALARNPVHRYPNALAFLDTLSLVARQLRILEGKHELRSFLAAVYRRNRTNLAGDEEPGVPVTEDRISEILKGIGGSPYRRYGSDVGVPFLETTRIVRGENPSHVSDHSGRSVARSSSDPGTRPTTPEIESEKTNAWGELDLEDRDYSGAPSLFPRK